MTEIAVMVVAVIVAVGGLALGVWLRLKYIDPILRRRDMRRREMRIRVAMAEADNWQQAARNVRRDDYGY